MLKKLLKRKKRILGIIAYWCIYLLGFFFVEKVVQHPVLLLHCTLDDWIPYCRYMLVFYLLWFPYIAYTIVYYLLYESDRKVVSLMKQLSIPMMLTLVWYLLVPNGTDLRSKVVLDSDLFSRILQMLWKSDPPNNVFPSIHVFVSILLNHALHETKRKNRVLEVCSTVLCVGICASTVFLKQHSVLDVLSGIGVAAVVIAISKKQDTKRVSCYSDR